MLIIAGKAVGMWFGGPVDASDVSMEEGSVADRVVLSLLLLLGLLILGKRRFNWVDNIKGNAPLILFLAFTVVSIAWSDTPYISLKRWFRELGIAIVMALVVSTEAEPREALKSLFRRIIYVHIPLSFLLIHYYPHLGRQYGRWSGQLMWTGVSMQKNGLALLCCFALFFFIWTFVRRWRRLDIPVSRYQKYIEMFIVMLSLWLFMGPDHTLKYSASATASLAIGIAALFSLLLLKRCNIIPGANSLAIFTALIVIYGTATPFLGGLTIFDPSGLLGRDQTLTGRSNTWAFLTPYAMQRPLLGHGYASFWTDELRASLDPHAHNSYLDMILSVGFIGLMLWSAFLVASCRKAQREMTGDSDWGIFCFCIILMTVIHSISESSATSFASLLPAFILFFTICSKPKGQYTPIAWRHKRA